MTTTESKQEIHASRDFARLGEFAQTIAGQPCIQARLSYGDELVVDFGERRSFKSKKLAHRFRGSWALHGRGTPWMVQYLDGGVTRQLTTGLQTAAIFTPDEAPTPLAPATQDEINRVLASLVGARVVKAVVAADEPDLALHFDNDHWLVLMTKYALPELDLAAWELSMPDGMYLKVFGRPSPAWSLLRSDSPI